MEINKEKLKAEFEKKFTYKAGDGARMLANPLTVDLLFEWILSQIEKHRLKP